MFPFGKIISGIPWQSAKPIKIDSALLCLDINHTTAATSGTVYAVDIDTTNSAELINNYRAFAVDLTMGAKCNGPYAAYFRTDCVTYQVGGLGAAMGMELCLPGATLASGEFHGMTMDFECAQNFSTGTGGKHSFIKFEIWGDSSAKTVFDDAFNLFFLNGMTSAAGNLVSLTEQTLRINIEGTSRYLMLSQAEDGLQLGTDTSSAQMDLVTSNAAHAIAVYTKSQQTGGSTSLRYIYGVNRMEAVGGLGGRAEFHTVTDVFLGNWCNALKAFMEFEAGGRVQGLASAITAELHLPNTTIPGGNYTCLDCEFTVGGGTTQLGAGSSFMTFQVNGTVATFEADGYLFSIDGIVEGNDKLCDNGGTDLTADGGIRIRIDGTDRWLLYADSPETN